MSYQIRVNCTCGKVLKIPEKYAGKRGRCPNCGKKIAIPSMEEIKNKIDSQKEPDEVNERTCPVCGSYLNPGDTVCVSCNANLRTGEWDGDARIEKISPFRNLHFIAAFVVLGIFILVAGKILVGQFSQTPPQENKALKPMPPTNISAKTPKDVKNLKSLANMPENTMEALEQKIEAFEIFLEEEAKAPKIMETYQALKTKKREWQARSLNLESTNPLERYMLLDKAINKYHETAYIETKLKEEKKNVERQIVDVARKQLESSHELMTEKKKQDVVARTIEWLSQVAKHAYPVDDFGKEIDAMAKICNEALATPAEKEVVVAPVPVKEEEKPGKDSLSIFKKDWHEFLPTYRELTGKSDYRVALDKLQPFVKQANDLREKYPEDHEVKKVFESNEQIKLLNRAMDYTIEGVEAWKGKTKILFPRDRKEKPVIGTIVNYENGEVHVKKDDNTIEKVALKALSSDTIKEFALYNNKKNPEIHTALACFYWMQGDSDLCIESSDKALKLGVSPTEVEAYRKWAQGVIQERQQASVAAAQKLDDAAKKGEENKEENRMDHLRKKAWRLVDNILREYRKKPSMGRDLEILEMLVQLKEQVGDEQNGRDELIKISKDVKNKHGQSITTICNTVFEYCPACRNSAEVSCPSCKGAGTIETEERWIGKGTTSVRIESKKKYCDQCKGSMKIDCPDCIQKRKDRRYKLIKDYYGNF